MTIAQIAPILKKMRKLIVFFLLAGSLLARENDPFTRRHHYEGKLPDFSQSLNKKTNELLQRAVTQFNAEHCENKYPVTRVQRLLAFYIYRFVASEHDEKVEPRFEDRVTLGYALGKKGLGPLQKWVREEADKKYIIDVTDNIYSNVYLLPDRYFRTFTVNVDDIYIAPDKIDHFFDQGYTYYVVSDFGKDQQKAIRRGIDGEYGFFGMKASGVFSFADLKSNYDGYVFYQHLFRERQGYSPLFSVDGHGCVKKTRDFKWENWISWQWDELFNPSFYKAGIRKKIKRNFSLNMQKHEYCKSYQHNKENGAYDYLKMRTKEYIDGQVPRVQNLFDIGNLCNQSRVTKNQ